MRRSTWHKHYIAAAVVCLVFQATAWMPSEWAEASYYDKSYALIIGIDQYGSRAWPQLKCAVAGAAKVAALLRNRQFQVRELYNWEASVDRITSEITGLADKLHKNDRVLIYYAGHGCTRIFGGQDFGYIVPYDASGKLRLISMDKIREWSAMMGAAKHQLFILDSCFGGQLGPKLVRAGGTYSQGPSFLETLAKRQARHALTAGGRNQPVGDDYKDGLSLFTWHFCEALGPNARADRFHNGYITYLDLASYITQAASNSFQTPSAFTLPGDEGGQFLFVSRLKPRPHHTDVRPLEARPRDSRPGYSQKNSTRHSLEFSTKVECRTEPTNPDGVRHSCRETLMYEAPRGYSIIPESVKTVDLEARGSEYGVGPISLTTASNGRVTKACADIYALSPRDSGSGLQKAELRGRIEKFDPSSPPGPLRQNIAILAPPSITSKLRLSSDQPMLIRGRIQAAYYSSVKADASFVRVELRDSNSDRPIVQDCLIGMDGSWKTSIPFQPGVRVVTIDASLRDRDERAMCSAQQTLTVSVEE